MEETWTVVNKGKLEVAPSMTQFARAQFARGEVGGSLRLRSCASRKYALKIKREV